MFISLKLTGLPLPMKLDQTDKKIIQLLGADARMSNNSMAKAIAVTEGTVRNRIQKLIKNKIIKISVINNINRMENPAVAFIGLDVETRSKDSVAKALSKMKEVRFVSTLIGRHDLMAFVLAKDINILSKVLYEDISSLPGVRFSESSIGLKYYKYDYRWARILD
jgi:Lrp/AsnC family transcriptional regulator for asnA, asnC and gidA